MQNSLLALTSSLRLACGLALFSLIGLPGLQAQVTVSFDYTYDANNFFSGANLSRRSILESAANDLISRLADTLAAISPGGGNTWSINFPNPNTGLTETIVNPSIAANTLVVYTGSRALSGSTLGEGGPGGFSASGTAGFISTVSTRGETGAPSTDFGPWGGAVTFDDDANWYFDSDPTTVETFSGQSDFYSVAVHELGHLLGIGTADSWSALINGSNEFTGSSAVALNGGNVPLSADTGHWAANTSSIIPGTSTVQETSMDPSLTTGTRKYFTNLDYAGLDDIGWEVTPVPEPQSMAFVTGILLAGFALIRRHS